MHTLPCFNIQNLSICGFWHLQGNIELIFPPPHTHTHAHQGRILHTIVAIKFLCQKVKGYQRLMGSMSKDSGINTKKITLSKKTNLFYFFLIVVLGRVHCSTYKGSYNVSDISYLKSPSPLLSFIPPSPDSWNNFSRCHFCVYIHVYTLFLPYSSSYPFP
jgi:hypothetical protein